MVGDTLPTGPSICRSHRANSAGNRGNAGGVRTKSAVSESEMETPLTRGVTGKTAGACLTAGKFVTGPGTRIEDTARRKPAYAVHAAGPTQCDRIRTDRPCASSLSMAANAETIGSALRTLARS